MNKPPMPPAAPKLRTMGAVAVDARKRLVKQYVAQGMSKPDATARAQTDGVRRKRKTGP